jgi:hypothetical protein
MLDNYGFSQRFQRRIQRMYEHATSSVQVNGYISKPLPIKCSIRQGCPPSMLLFTLCLDPLLSALHDRLTASSKGRQKYRTAVIAYADDITIILRSPKDAAIVQEEIRNYEAASGAKMSMTANKHDSVMVQMARRNLPRSTIYFIQTGGTRGLGTNTCRALLWHRLQTQGKKHGSLTALWLEEWNLLLPSENPPPTGTESRPSWNTCASYGRTPPTFHHKDRRNRLKHIGSSYMALSSPSFRDSIN